MHEVSEQLCTKLRKHGMAPTYIAVVKTAIEKLEGADELKWNDLAPLIDQLDEDPGNCQLVAHFGAQIIGKVDVMHITYALITEALEQLEQRMPPQHWPLAWKMIEHSGGFVLDYGPDR